MNNKKRKFKRKMFFASQYEIEAIENFLEQEAANGWMFVKCSGMFFVFEKCAPVRLKFQVDYFDKATIFDTNPQSKTLDYIEYCNESGWHHIFSSGKLQIFYSICENPIPIQTDENMKLKLASKATILANWCTWILLPLIWGLGMGRLALMELLDPRYYFTYSNSLTSFGGIGLLGFWLLFTLLGIINMIRFGIFYFRNKKRLKNGLDIQYYSSKNVKRFGTFHKICLLLLSLVLVVFSMNSFLPSGTIFLMLFGMVAMIFWINKITHSKWANRQINIVIAIVVPIVLSNIIIIGAVFSVIGMHHSKITSGNTTYFYSTDTIDVTLADLGIDKTDRFIYEETSHHKAGSFLAAQESYDDYYKEEDKSYGYSIEIFSSKYESIMDKYNELILEGKNYTFTQLADTQNMWKADRVYYGNNGHVSMYAVIGEGNTFVIEGELNEEQAAKLSTYYIDKQIECDK